MSERKAKTVKMSYYWRRFWTVTAMLVFCLALFCSNALALYSINNTGASDVYGFPSDDDLFLLGPQFGTVTATATSGDNAYGLYDDNDIRSIIILDGIPGGGVISGTASGNNAAAMYSYGGIAIWASSPGSNYMNGTITATAGGNGAYGLYAGSAIQVGDIGGTIIATAGTNSAYGLYSDDDMNIGNINGTITATATDGNFAYGLHSESDMTTGNINGTITATAGIHDAYGLYSDGDMTIGDINGAVTATAGKNNAYGLYSDGDMTIGNININGTITATATDGNYASGLYSDGNMTIGNINGTITAKAGTNWASGLYSDGDMTIGDINGAVTATAGKNNAYGLYSDGDMTIGNININGTITATATDGNYAAGLYSDGDMTIGDINGTITATAGIYEASGLYSDGNMTTGNINGTITATAGRSDAYGLYSDGDMTVGNINGTITATATDGNYASGLYSDGDMTTGNINGTITARAGIHDASGLYSDGDMYIGDINGTITATAGINDAYGLYSEGDMTTGNINGTITATATDGNYATGLYSDGNMTIGNINGTITATAGIYDAGGLYSGGDMTIGDINGAITATAGSSDVSGLYSEGNMTIGNINGTITATATDGNYATGLCSDGNMTIGNINGTITATAGIHDVSGLYSGGNMNIGNINGTITATAGVNNAYGLYSEGTLTTGDINGTITATATNGNYASGLYSDGNLTTGAINGDINATAGTDHAYGLYSANGNIKTGGITGTITASAGQYGAVGLYATNGSIETGAITGTITATTGIGCAYGMWSDGNMSIDSIGSTGTITATAQSLDAIGLYSGGVLTIGAINGTIDANVIGGSSSWGAYGLKAADSINTGAINDTITAINGGSGEGAYGLYADSNITTGAINGTITATAGGSDAYGLYAGNLLTVASIGYDAHITATAGTNGAYGLYSDGNIITGAVNGTINATANHYGAYGIYAHDDLTINGDIGGPDDINAAAGYSGAYGLYAKHGDINVVGNINGTITATAGQNGAYGLYAKHGDIYTGAINGTIDANATTGNNAIGLYARHGSITTGAISGTISAHAGGDYAYGILSYGPMNVTIDGGTVGANANGGHFAAIQSGRLSGGSLEVQNADDIVNIAAGSVIDANIDLGMNGTDHDVLTLYGNSWNSTVLNYDINNVEDINITGGVWHVNGNIINNADGVKVYDEGILEGTGNLGNLFIMDGGTLNPGNSIGTINVTNLTFSSGSTYIVEVNNSGKADKVNVSGMATLDGTIHPVALERIRDIGTFSATVIDAPAVGEEDDPCLVGSFATIAGQKLFLRFGVDYEYQDGDVILDVTKKSYADFAHSTRNERSIGHAFDRLVKNDEVAGGSDMDTVISYFDNLNQGEDKEAKKAYDQIMPQDVLGLPEVVRNMMNQFSEGVFDHIGSVQNSRQYAMMGDSSNLMASASDSPTATPKVDKWMPYAKGFGTWGSRDGKDDISGYNYNIYGMMGGMDMLISDSTLLGFSMGGAATNVDYKQDSTNADISSMLVSLYGAYFQDNWHVGLNLGYSHNWYDTQRGINFDSIDRTAKSSYEGNAYNIATEFGNNFGGTSMLLEPVAGVGYTAVQQGSYKETGAKSLDLHVDSETSDGIYTKLGLRWAKEFRSEQNPDMVFVPKANVFWIHDFADNATFDSKFVNGGSFSTDSMNPVRDSFNFGAGLNVYLSKSTRLFVDYGWQGASSFDASTLSAGAQWSF